MNDIARLRSYRESGKSVSPDELIGWHCRWRVDKFDSVDLALPREHALWERGLILPSDYVEGELNTLTTVGATDTLNGLVTAPANLWNATNAGLSVGDSSTAATAGQTDLQAAAGSTITTSGFTSVTNATPIVYTNGSGTWTVTPVAGQCFVISGLTTNTQANGTFEIAAASLSTTVFQTVSSVGNGVTGALASGLAKLINRFSQNVNGTPVISTNTIQFVAVYSSTHANFAWQEFGTFNIVNFNTATGATTAQLAPPTKMLNRAVASNGTKAAGSSWTLTETISLT